MKNPAGTSSNPLPVWVTFLLCLIYVISPIDALPDFIPVAGQLDDLAVLGYAGYQLFRRMKSALG